MSAFTGPAPLVTGAQGTLKVGGLRAGELSEWRIVTSPTTGLPTLIGTGSFRRYFRQGVGCAASATLIPRAPHAYVGRPKPPPARPFQITGTLAELSSTSVTIASGTIVRG